MRLVNKNRGVHILCFGVVLGFLVVAVQADASVTSRDADVDSMLMADGGLGGVLPPTGGQAAVPTGIVSGASSFVDPALPGGGTLNKIVTADKVDNKGRVYDMKGRARIAKKDVQGLEDLKIDSWIEEGHVVITEKGSSVSITFDDRYLNVVHIPENTRAEFRSIEPTQIHLEDGTLFNILDGLPRKQEWKVSTPTAIAAVRGTLYVVQYTASNGDVITATLNVPEDGESSIVELIDILPDGAEGSSVNVPEGQQIYLKAGEEPDPSLLEKIDPKWLQQIMEVLEKLADLRENAGQGGLLPPTSGEFFEPGTIDPAGPGNVGGGPDDTLDPLIDSGSAMGDDGMDSFFDSSGSSYEEPEYPEEPEEPEYPEGPEYPEEEPRV